MAAGQFVSELPYVDAENVFVTGHSVGGVLAALAAMMPSRYKACAALSGYLDMATWSEYQDASLAIYDANDPKEILLRNPMEFAASLRIPITLYAERGGMDEVNAAFVDRAKHVGKSCDFVIVDGDHTSMVAPAVQHAIKWYQELLTQ